MVCLPSFLLSDGLKHLVEARLYHAKGNKLPPQMWALAVCRRCAHGDFSVCFTSACLRANRWQAGAVSAGADGRPRALIPSLTLAVDRTRIQQRGRCPRLRAEEA